MVVVDLKTGRTAPSGPKVLQHRQLGLYQYAVDHGAVDDRIPDARAGGAELVQIGLTQDGDAKVQKQPAQLEDGPERDRLRAELGAAAAMLRAERFPAVVGDHCRECAFVSLCPAKSAGSVISR